MIKVTLKSIEGTIAERKFETIEECLEWVEMQMFTTRGAVGYTLETEVDE